MGPSYVNIWKHTHKHTYVTCRSTQSYVLAVLEQVMPWAVHKRAVPWRWSRSRRIAMCTGAVMAGTYAGTVTQTYRRRMADGFLCASKRRPI